MVAGRLGRGTPRALAAVGLAAVLALGLLGAGCSSESSDVTSFIPAYVGGQAVGPGGTILFQAHTFFSDVYVTLRDMDANLLAATPVGPVVGAIEFDVTAGQTFQIPASARFRLFGAAQTVGTRLNVYQRYAGADTLVGQAEVETNGTSAYIESAIPRQGIYVVGAPSN